MNHRHVIGASALFLAISITGCANPQQSPQPDETPDGAKQERFSQLAQKDEAVLSEETRTDLDLGAGKTEHILAQKTASYAEEIERLLAARAAEGAAARAAAHVPTPSPTPAQTPVPAPAPTHAAVTPPAKEVTAEPAPAKSQVVFADPRELPPAQAIPQNATVAQTPAVDIATQKPAIHQLLDTGPATANQAQHIPASGEQVASSVQPPLTDLKPQAAAQAPPRQHIAELLGSADPLSRKLSDRIKSDPLDVGAHLDYQLLQMLNDQSVPELDAIAPLPQEDREIVSAVLDGLSNFRHGIRTGGNALLGQKIGPIVEMGERIRHQTTLSIPTLVLCRDVKQFGVYQPLESTRFPFGQKHPAVVYCEVANFASHLNSRNLWETKLTYEVLLYTENASLQVWQHKPTPVVDHSNSRRRDFFIAKLIEFPADLPIGGYLMKVSIVDETANRIAEATVPLQVVAK